MTVPQDPISADAPASAGGCAVLINGAVGVGKTSVAYALSARMTARAERHAVVDLDELRRLSPAPPEDPFAETVGLENLAAVWRNYRRAGARALIIASVVESTEDLRGMRRVIGDTHLSCVRLRATPQTLTARLQARESATRLPWYLHRAQELSAILDAAGLAETIIDCDDLNAEDVAAELDRHWAPRRQAASGTLRSAQ